MERQKIIPNHQFGFQHKHVTIGQIHRIVKRISIDMDERKLLLGCLSRYLTGIFDKVWHVGVLHKIKSCFPVDLYTIIKSYLLQRSFRVIYVEALTQLKDINSGVPQGSMLGSVLYLLYTANFLLALDATIATYADDIAILTAHKSYIKASQRLQESLFYIQKWLKKWRIRVNGAKSVQVTFTIRRKTNNNQNNMPTKKKIISRFMYLIIL